MDKICYRCLESKEEALFKRDYKNKEIIKYTNLCLDCSKIVFKEWRILNKEKYNKHYRTRRWERKLRAIEYKGSICECCKQKVHPAAFDFHHIDPKEKDTDPGLMMSCSDEKLFLELDKCVLLCSNCHREEHFKNGY